MNLVQPTEKGKSGENKNISNINMSKKLKTNIAFLQGFIKNAKPEIKPKVSNLIELYASRKISNLTTVENMIMKLRGADPKLRDSNPNSTKKAYQKYDKLVTKYENLEPLNVRMSNTKNKNKEIKVVAQKNTASLKISKLFKSGLRISVSRQETAMGKKVVNMTMNFDYIGSVVKFDLPAILAKSYLSAQKEMNTKLEYKFFSTIRLWITKKQDDDDVGGLIKNPVYSGDFPSNKTADWLDTFIEKIYQVLQSGDAIDLKKSILNISFILQPQGSGRSTDDRSKDSILNKSSVIKIINDDNNCFWYALTISINKDNSKMKDQRYPNKRNAFAKELCRKCKLKWDEPVSFIHLPLIEEALNITIYIINLNDIPQLGTAINLWDCLMYKSGNNQNEKHWLLFDEDHYNVITKIAAFMAVRHVCNSCLKCFLHKAEFENHDCTKIQNSRNDKNKVILKDVSHYLKKTVCKGSTDELELKLSEMDFEDKKHREN